MNRLPTGHLFTVIAFGAPVLFAVLGFIIPPGIYSDSGYGLLVWKSLLEGAPFNFGASPNPMNIEIDAFQFMTWWTPGQYLVPGLFHSVGFNYGQACVLSVAISTILGLLGWWQVAKQLGIGKIFINILLMSLVCFRFGTIGFRMYLGGEHLLFALSPWALLLVKALPDTSLPLSLTGSLLTAFLLFIAKLSGLIVFASIAVAVVLTDVFQSKRIRPGCYGIILGSGFTILLYKYLWLSFGANPATGDFTKGTWDAFSYPISASIFAGTSFLDMLSWLLIHPSRPLLASNDLSQISWITAIPALSLGVWVSLKMWNQKSYQWLGLWGLISAFYILAFSVLWLKGSSISFDERHFRFPGIMTWLSLLLIVERSSSQFLKICTISVFIVFAGYGLASLANGSLQSIRNNKLDATSGLQQTDLTPATFHYLIEKRKSLGPKDPIVVVPSPEAGLGLPQFRLISPHLDFNALEDIQQLKFSGRVEKIFVVVQEKMLWNGKAQALLDAFHDYNLDEWSSSKIDNLVVYETVR